VEAIPGFLGDGIQSPLILKAPAELKGDELENRGVTAPQNYGTSERPFTTARADLFPGATNTLRPYSPAGKLTFTASNNTPSSCTASLVMLGVLVTAAHCVMDFNTNKFFTGFQFAPGYRNGEAPYGILNIKNSYVLSAWSNGTDSCVMGGNVYACRSDVAVQVVSRVVKHVTGSWQANSTSVTVSSTAGVVADKLMEVSGPGIPPNALVLAKDQNTLTLCVVNSQGLCQANPLTAPGSNVDLTISWATYPGLRTGYFGISYSVKGAAFTPLGLAQITQLGYPACLDSSEYMERTDSQGAITSSQANNTIFGSLQCEGSSGGPVLVNFGIRPTLTGTEAGQWPFSNQVVGVVSWGAKSDTPVNRAIKLTGATPFEQDDHGNIKTLLIKACEDDVNACGSIGTVNVTFARYGADRTNVVTDKFQDLCRGNRFCIVPINNNSMGGDPSPNQQKSAYYQWNCEGIRYAATTNQNDTAHLYCW
jgi:V8-like Glu-specific endopeptidase